MTHKRPVKREPQECDCVVSMEYESGCGCSVDDWNSCKSQYDAWLLERLEHEYHYEPLMNYQDAYEILKGKIDQLIREIKEG